MIPTDHISAAAFGGRTKGRGSVLGWAISLLAHAMMLSWLWYAAPPRPMRIDTKQDRRMAVWLVPGTATRPLPFPAIGAPIDVARSKLALTRAIPVPSHKAFQPHSGTAPATPAVHQSPALRATLPAPDSRNEPENGAAGAAPGFDLAAARSSARAMAREEQKDVGALPLRQTAMRATTSDRMQERLERAHRGKCLKGNESMNLLANVALLARDMVANAVDDSGCKW